ncbi:hypothetical protein [Aeromicrobium sp. UC242_57]
MTINVTNHLNFRGDARAALELYQSVFGGDRHHHEHRCVLGRRSV